MSRKIVENILAVNPTYTFTNTLASNLIEMAHEQIFFAKHKSSLTDIKVEKEYYLGIAGSLRSTLLLIY